MPDKWTVDTDIVSAVQDIYPDCSTAKAIKYLNIVRANVLRYLSIHRTSENLSLTAGTAEYAYSANVDRVESVEYHRSATASDYRALLPIDLSQLEAEETRWRGYTNAEPQRFYLTAGSTGPLIGLVPAPSLTTTSSYPVLTVFENTYNALSAGGTFNDDLHSVEVYVNGIARQFAKANDLPNYPLRDGMYQQSLNQAQDYLYKKNAHLSTRMKPSWIKSRGVI